MNGNMGKSAMRYRTFILMMLVFSSTVIFAQSNPLQIELAALQADVQVNMSWRATLRPAGLLIAFPSDVQLVPISMAIDNRSLWLLNDSAVPARDSVIAWQITPEGLILLFREGLIENNQVLELSCHSNLANGQMGPVEVQIRAVQVTESGIETSSPVISSGIIPARQIQTEN